MLGKKSPLESVMAVRAKISRSQLHEVEIYKTDVKKSEGQMVIKLSTEAPMYSLDHPYKAYNNSGKPRVMTMT